MTQDALIGQRLLGRHRVIRELARGGMGAVYLGRTEGASGFARPVVIKRILPDLVSDEETAKMFAREARVLSHLRHPGIVSVLDFGKEHGAHIMVLEYVHGYDVARWCTYLQRVGRLIAVDHAVYIMTQVLEALHHAHEAKRSDGTYLRIVHRDVSPTNILVDIDAYVKIVDFGIARITGDPSEFKTKEQSFKGKIGYAAPELLQGTEPTPSADTYSAAVVLYQILTGKHPFRGKTVTDTVMAILTDSPPPLHELRKDAPPELSQLVARAIAKNPEDRFPSAHAFAATLRTVYREPEEQVRQGLLETIKEDFRDDRIAKTMSFEPLSSLDAAWRQATGVISVQAPSVSPRSMPTRKPGARFQSGRPSLRAQLGARGLWVAIFSLGALVLAVVVVGAVLLLRRPTPSSSNRYVVIEKDAPSSATEEPAAPVRPADAKDTPTDLGPVPAAPAASAATQRPDAASAAATASPPRKGDGRVDAAALTQTFSEHMGPIRRCLTTHRTAVAETAQMSILFSIDRQGRVTNASLSPSSLQSTDMGQCVLIAARSIPFGPQPEPASFRIPITMGYK